MSEPEIRVVPERLPTGRPAPYLVDVDATFTAIVDGEQRELDIYTQEGFQVLSNLWLRAGWQQKFSYELTWLGIPVIQLPEDVVLMQELAVEGAPGRRDRVRRRPRRSPNPLRVRARVARERRVVGVDVEIRKYNRLAIESHPLSHRISLIEGSSVSPETLAAVRAHIRPSDRVLVVLDSLHTRAHVAAELESYAPLVTPSSYLVVFDGVMSMVADAPNAGVDWETDNPLTAVDDFLVENLSFERDPAFGRLGVTYCPAGFLRRRDD